MFGEGELAFEVRFIELPVQIVEALAEAVTPVGFGLTVMVLVAVAVHEPGLVTVTV